MDNWTAGDLMDQIQELIGEPAGGFYNIASRLRQLNRAQTDLVEDTRALRSEETITVSLGTSAYDLPYDFLTFAQEKPTFTPTGDTVRKLELTHHSWLDQVHPGWQDTDTHKGTPTHFIREDDQILLYPAPTQGGTLTLPYTPQPWELTSEDDEPFNGNPKLNRYAPALAYKVAWTLTIARSPQLAQYLENLYESELRSLRGNLRSSPLRKQTIRPTGGSM